MKRTLLIGREQIRNLLKEDIWVYGSSGEPICINSEPGNSISFGDRQYFIADEVTLYKNPGRRDLVRPQYIGIGRDEREIYNLSLANSRIQILVVSDGVGIPGDVIVDKEFRLKRQLRWHI